MRTYIYTPNERKVLTTWLRGLTAREDSTILDHVLTRTKDNYATLTRDIRFFTLTLRKLNAGRPKRHRSDLEVTLAIAPLILKAVNREAYTLLPMLRRAEETANDPSKSAEARLDALEEVVRLARELMGSA